MKLHYFEVSRHVLFYAGFELVGGRERIVRLGSCAIDNWLCLKLMQKTILVSSTQLQFHRKLLRYYFSFFVEGGTDENNSCKHLCINCRFIWWTAESLSKLNLLRLNARKQTWSCAFLSLSLFFVVFSRSQIRIRYLGLFPFFSM